MGEEIKPKKKSRTNWIVLTANAVVVLMLVFAYLATQIPPRTFGYLALFGLLYPVSLMLNIVFIFYRFLTVDRLILISLKIVKYFKKMSKKFNF